jgi:hypothetical protein
MQGEVQAVTKVYDILKWLIPQMSRFPRSHKFTLGDRITNVGLDILMLLVEANYTRDKLELLRQANTNSRRGGLMVFDSVPKERPASLEAPCNH